MKRRLLAALALSGLAASCATPAVYGPEDREGDGANGTIKPLANVLRDAGGRSLRLVFVHGVGDHCAGYALDPDKGWLSDKTARKVGLQGNDLPRYRKVQASVFIAGSENQSSYAVIGKRNYSFQLGWSSPIEVEAIEITWSHTTQWLKSNYLGYDSPSVTPRGRDDVTNCVDAENETVPFTKRPPERLPLDRLIKEQVFDRNLADAIIYSGVYGEVIERAFADGLCRALVETPDTQACAWEAVDLQADATRRYVFVTHSLGSRVVYDALLDLAGSESPGRTNKFLPGEWSKSRPVIQQLIANTPLVLMMANQLSLLGLANAPPASRADEEPRPLFVNPEPDSMQRDGRDLGTKRALIARRACRNVMTAFARFRAEAVVARNGVVADDELTLRVIAFNDTNDLLTWHIPKWYAKGDDACEAKLALTNVFVRNTVPWLIAEPPLAAHTNYFRNDAVWQAIVCGATAGKLLDCKR
jgi:hypothetical protein